MQSRKPTEWHNLWDKLLKAPAGKERLAFVHFCKGMITLAAQGKITREDAALSIAEVYGNNRFDDSDRMEEIMHLALQLEVPDNMNEEGWNKLQTMVAAPEDIIHQNGNAP